MDEKDMTLEERMKELNEIIRKMENPDVSLEKSFELYKTGVTRLKECTDMIDNIEKELIVLEEGQEE
ncbi:MAG: exodeoxyribonuclease VII small subunit [Lachnospiraceae bacterium]|nr:exodeoxyribonuclease VII small subunit [Lachnospiraceae bacterium]